MTEKQGVRAVAIYGDDVVTLAERMRFRCAHKQRNLERLASSPEGRKATEQLGHDPDALRRCSE